MADRYYGESVAKAEVNVPTAPVDLELAGALSDLREIAAMASKSAEDYLTARDRWVANRDSLDRAWDLVKKLREQHDAK